MEIEIGTFGHRWECEVDLLLDRQTEIQVRGRSVALCRVFGLNFNRIHLTQVNLVLWFLIDKHPRYACMYVKLYQDTNCFYPVESKGYKFRFIRVQNYLAIGGAQFGHSQEIVFSLELKKFICRII